MDHKSTVSRILKDSHKRLNEDITNPNSKRHKSVKFPELEQTLMEFILTYQHRTILSDAIIYSQTFSVELAGKYNKGKSVHY